MKFWEIYFKFVEVLKQQLSIYEELLARWPQNSAVTPSIVRTSVKRETGTTKSVLIVEPLERNRVLISRYLTAVNVNVSFAVDESEANGRSAQGHFDLKISTAGMKFPEDKNSLLERV